MLDPGAHEEGARTVVDEANRAGFRPVAGLTLKYML